MFKRILAVICLTFAVVGCEATEPVDRAEDVVAFETGERAGPLAHYAAAIELGVDCAAETCDDTLYVKAVNQAKTRCVDGQYADKCPVDGLTFDDPDLTVDKRAEYERMFRQGYGVADGWMEYAETEYGVTIMLHVLDPWVGAVNKIPTTPVYNVWDADLYCVKAPCPDYQGNALNEPDTTLIYDVDLTTAGATDDAVEYGHHLLSKQRLLIAGEFTYDGIAYEPVEVLTAETFYLLVR